MDDIGSGFEGGVKSAVGGVRDEIGNFGKNLNKTQDTAEESSSIMGSNRAFLKRMILGRHSGTGTKKEFNRIKIYKILNILLTPSFWAVSYFGIGTIQFLVAFIFKKEISADSFNNNFWKIITFGGGVFLTGLILFIVMILMFQSPWETIKGLSKGALGIGMLIGLILGVQYLYHKINDASVSTEDIDNRLDDIKQNKITYHKQKEIEYHERLMIENKEYTEKALNLINECKEKYKLVHDKLNDDQRKLMDEEFEYYDSKEYFTNHDLNEVMYEISEATKYLDTLIVEKKESTIQLDKK